MTDRELLELAAKAAGVALVDGEHGDMLRVYYTDPHNGLNRYTPWNPLTDDGDALRLAVRLGLLVYVMLDAGFTGIRLPGENVGGKYDEVQMHGTDHYAATRRAIVRAAAELGKGL